MDVSIIFKIIKLNLALISKSNFPTAPGTQWWVKLITDSHPTNPHSYIVCYSGKNYRHTTIIKKKDKNKNIYLNFIDTIPLWFYGSWTVDTAAKKSVLI